MANEKDLVNLRSILKSFGIETERQLDKALAESLDLMEVGIMTQNIKSAEKSA